VPGGTAASSPCGAEHRAAPLLPAAPAAGRCQPGLCRAHRWHSGCQPGAAPCCSSPWLCQMPTATDAHGHQGTRPLARAAVSPTLPSGWVQLCPCCSFSARQGARAGSVLCDLGTPVPWAWASRRVRLQLVMAHSYHVLHHDLWLSITPHGSPS